jgi:hypothetical protein
MNSKVYSKCEDKKPIQEDINDRGRANSSATVKPSNAKSSAIF